MLITFSIALRHAHPKKTYMEYAFFCNMQAQKRAVERKKKELAKKRDKQKEAVDKPADAPQSQ